VSSDPTIIEIAGATPPRPQTLYDALYDDVPAAHDDPVDHGHGHGHEHGHDHGHDHGPKLIRRFAKLFKHDHSGQGPSGALVVEGPDDVGHVGTVLDSAVRGAQHGAHDPSPPHTILEALQRIGTSSSTAEAAFSVGLSTPVALLGLYTFAVSLQEIHEASHSRADLNRERADIQGQIDRLRGLRERERSGDFGDLVTMQGAVLEALTERLDSSLNQNRRDRKFWQYSASSGALVATKAVTDVISGLSTLKPAIAIPATVASTVGGTATTAIAAPAAAVAMGVGAMSRATARAAQKELEESPLREALRRLPEGSPLRQFGESKHAIRRGIYKRVGDWSTAFTASNGASLAGGVLGGVGGLLLGTGLAAASHGVTAPAIPHLVVAGAAVGATGSAGALSSVWVLPYGHMKKARYQRYEGRGRSQESALLAMAHLREPAKGFEIQAQRLREIRAKHARVQLFLETAAEQTHRAYTSKKHKSDPAEDTATSKNEKPIRKLSPKSLEAWMRDTTNFEGVRGWMRESIAIENEENSFLRQKDALRKDLLGVKVPSDASRDSLRELILPRFDAGAQQDRSKQKKLTDLSETLAAVQTNDGTIENVLGDFLTLQGAPEIKKGDSFKRAARYCLVNEPSLDRDARGELFASLDFGARIAHAAAPRHPKQELGAFDTSQTLTRLEAVSPAPEPAMAPASDSIQPSWEFHYGTFGVDGTFSAGPNAQTIRFGKDVIPKRELAAATGLDLARIEALAEDKNMHSIKLVPDGQHRLKIDAVTRQPPPSPRLGR
jgi:hypothetical protein